MSLTRQEFNNLYSDKFSNQFRRNGTDKKENYNFEKEMEKVYQSYLKKEKEKKIDYQNNKRCRKLTTIIDNNLRIEFIEYLLLDELLFKFYLETEDIKTDGYFKVNLTTRIFTPMPLMEKEFVFLGINFQKFFGKIRGKIFPPKITVVF